MALRRYSPFANELGEIPLENLAATIEAVLGGSWGTWTGSMSAHHVYEAVLTGSWGGWTGTVTAVVHVPATLTATWGGATGATTAVVSRAAVLSATWGGWTGSATAVVHKLAVIAATWGTWDGEMAATIHTPGEATLDASWGVWTAALTAALTHEAVLAATWGTWTGSMTVIVHEPAILSAVWGGWAGAMSAHVPIEAVLAATWGAWTGSIVAIVHEPATLAASWGVWTGSAFATARVPATLAATWGSWTASATAHIVVAVHATLAATWGAWTATATAEVRPVNDQFSTAITIAPGVPATGTNVNASVQVGERVDLNGENCSSVWWKFTASGPLTATISTLGSDFNTVLGVFTGPDVAHLTLVTENDDFTGTTSQVTFVATQGVTYYIRVTGFGCAEGNIALSLTTVNLPPVFAADWGTWYAHAFVRPHTPPRTSPLVPYTIGCGIYEAYIKTRGGYDFVGRARNITNLKWSRVLNDVSEAEITFALNGDQGNCCDLAATINPWEHELAIYRDGGEVWTGPITGGKIDLTEGSATFSAKDLFAWFDHRWVEVRDNDVEFEDADITELFLWLLDHGYWKDPFNLEWFMAGDRLNVPMTRTYVAATSPDRWGGVYQNVGTELRDLVNSKIDFTTIRRNLIAGNLQQNSRRTEPIQLLDQDWEKLPDINIIGSGMTTEQGVGGSNAGYFGYDDDQMWIERAPDAYREKYGLLQSFDSAAELDDIDTYETPNPITQRAFELLEIRKQPFVYLSGGIISRHAPITTDQLIPGHHFRVALNQTCRTVRSNYLLTRADFTFDGDSEGIALELVPPGVDMLKGGV